MAKRVYIESVKKWVKNNPVKTGVAGTAAGGGLIFWIFLMLFSIGTFTLNGASGDVVCAGTLDDPCTAYINFTVNNDTAIYPIGYDPWGRDTPMNFEPGVKDWKIFYRSWGKTWREIDLTKRCAHTWCGASPNDPDNAFAFMFREGRDYQLKIEAYKEDPFDEIKWWGFGAPDPVFKAVTMEKRVRPGQKVAKNVVETFNRSVIKVLPETAEGFGNVHWHFMDIKNTNLQNLTFAPYIYLNESLKVKIELMDSKTRLVPNMDLVCKNGRKLANGSQERTCKSVIAEHLPHTEWFVTDRFDVSSRVENGTNHYFTKRGVLIPSGETRRVKVTYETDSAQGKLFMGAYVHTKNEFSCIERDACLAVYVIDPQWNRGVTGMSPYGAYTFDNFRLSGTDAEDSHDLAGFTAIGDLSKDSTVTTGSSGVINESFTFTGAGQYTSDKSFAFMNTTTFTDCKWINASNPSGISRFVDWVTGGREYKAEVRGDISDKLRVSWNDGSGTLEIDSPSAFDFDENVHLCIRINSTKTEVYYNAVLNFSSTAMAANTLITSKTNLTIGAGTGGVVRYTGQIDEDYYWNDTLSADEIAYLYAGGTPSAPHQYPFINNSNATPTVNTVDINPHTAFANTTLEGYANVTDSDGDNVTVYFTWYRNDTANTTGHFAIPALNVNTSVSNISYVFEKGDVWTFGIIVGDGNSNSSETNSSSVTILNTLPVASNAVISPSSPVLSDYLTFTADLSDLDGDTITNLTQWYINGTEDASFENLSVIGPTNTTVGQNWSACITPTDDEGNGTTVCASNVTISAASAIDASNATFTFLIPINGTLVYSLGFELNTTDNKTSTYESSISGTTNTSIGSIVGSNALLARDVGSFSFKEQSVKASLGNLFALPFVFNRTYGVFFMLNQSNEALDKVEVSLNITDLMLKYTNASLVGASIQTDSFLMTYSGTTGGTIDYNSTQTNIPVAVS